MACPKCGSEAVKRVIKRTSTGKGMLWVGGILTPFVGIGLPILAAGILWRPEANKCVSCNYLWRDDGTPVVTD